MTPAARSLGPAERARWAHVGALAAVALVLGYLETFVPLPIPGAKLGLANIPVLVALAEGDRAGACWVAGLKVVAGTLLFGGPVALAYSLAGTALSLAAMVPLAALPTLRLPMLSVVGATAHEAGQLLVARAMLGTPLVWYAAPPLFVAGCATGWLCGAVAARSRKELAAGEGRGAETGVVREGEQRATGNDGRARAGDADSTRVREELAADSGQSARDTEAGEAGVRRKSVAPLRDPTATSARRSGAGEAGLSPALPAGGAITASLHGTVVATAARTDGELAAGSGRCSPDADSPTGTHRESDTPPSDPPATGTRRSAPVGAPSPPIPPAIGAGKGMEAPPGVVAALGAWLALAVALMRAERPEVLGVGAASALAACVATRTRPAALARALRPVLPIALVTCAAQVAMLWGSEPAVALGALELPSAALAEAGRAALRLGGICAGSAALMSAVGPAGLARALDGLLARLGPRAEGPALALGTTARVTPMLAAQMGGRAGTRRTALASWADVLPQLVADAYQLADAAGDAAMAEQGLPHRQEGGS